MIKIILFFLLIPFFSVAQKKHVHKPNLSDSAKRVGSGQYDQLVYKDYKKIKHNVINYMRKNYLCTAGEWYYVRQNVDTFSTRRRGKYSNLVKIQYKKKK